MTLPTTTRILWATLDWRQRLKIAQTLGFNLDIAGVVHTDREFLDSVAKNGREDDFLAAINDELMK